MSELDGNLPGWTPALRIQRAAVYRNSASLPHRCKPSAARSWCWPDRPRRQPPTHRTSPRGRLGAARQQL